MRVYIVKGECSKARFAGAGREGGFALVLTLVVITVLALVTEMMTVWVTGALDAALANRREAEAQQQAADAEAMALFVLGTRPRSFRGVELMTIDEVGMGNPGIAQQPRTGTNYLRLDDQPYRLGGALVRFQDTRGLINLNLGFPSDIYTLLGAFGVAAADRDALIDKLLDYLDADTFRRLNGAEAPQYQEAGLDPPANAPLRTPWEVRRILGWNKIEEIAQDDSAWPLLTSIEPVAGFNVNTAPRALLLMMPFLNADLVDRILETRRQRPIIGALEWAAVTGIVLEPGPSRFLFYPANSTILTLSSEQWPIERRIAVRQTPRSPDSPWTIDYDVATPRAARRAHEADPDDFPISGLLSPKS